MWGEEGAEEEEKKLYSDVCGKFTPNTKHKRGRQLNYYKEEVQLKPKRSFHNYKNFICFPEWDKKSRKKKKKNRE